jgi:phosphohistidine phosphatase
MSRIYLLRHAKAVQALPGMKDFDRPLDDSGRNLAARLGAVMLANGLIPDKIIASPSGRTRETLASIAARIPERIDTEFDRMLFDGPEGSYLSAIKRSGNAKSVMLVGHNPMTEEAAIQLCGSGAPEARRTLLNGFPTGGLAVIDLPGPLADAKPGSGNLAMFIIGGSL